MNERRLNKGVVYSIIISFISVVIISFAGITYTGYVARKSDHRWCELLSTLDDGYRSAPITSPVGKRIAAEIHKLKFDFSC